MPKHKMGRQLTTTSNRHRAGSRKNKRNAVKVPTVKSDNYSELIVPRTFDWGYQLDRAALDDIWGSLVATKDK